MRILAVNAGSSSLKLSVVDDEGLCGAHELAAPGSEVDAELVESAVRALGHVDAVGHRIVHGGTRYTGPVRIDDEVAHALQELSDLAPLHQAKSLAALTAVSGALPDAPAVACFDTAFHATLPPHASTYALPRTWREEWGLRRFGFHGLSHAYAARRAGELLERSPEQLRIVTCHLGAGASLAAVQSGRSVDTTMGFTPLDGLAMATRSGSVDPGLLLWVLEHKQLDEHQVTHALEHESGMLGIAGSADMRVIIDGAQSGNGDCELALAVYVHRVKTGIAAMAGAMDGVDAVVWTGGVGEHAASIRAAATEGLFFMGLALDDEKNEAASGDLDVSAEEVPIRTLVVHAREDLEIARGVREVLHLQSAD